MNPKPKFLLIVGNNQTFWTHRVGLAKAIMNDGYELHLATSDATNDKGLKKLGIIPHDLPPYTSSLNPFVQIQIFIKILRIIKTLNPQIIHAITIRYGFLTGFCCRILRLKTPAVFTIAGLGSLFTSDNMGVQCVRFVLARTMKFVFGGKNRAIIFQNSDDGKRLIALGAVSKENAHLVRGSGVDIHEFVVTPEPENAPPVVLFCSRLLKSKGIGEFVHAARILKSKGVEARFVVAGDFALGNHDSVSSDDMKDWVEEGVIEWLGHCNDIVNLMAGCSIFTLPSYYGEGVPKVLLEAAASGRAIVTTTMPGCKDVVENDVTGILVEPRNAWALADALEKLIHDGVLRVQMGLAGRKRVEDYFALDIVNTKTLAVYRHIME